MQRGGGGQRPCKFGPRCNKLAQGACTYYHPPGQMPQGGGGGNRPNYDNKQQQGGGFSHHNRAPQGGQGYDQGGYGNGGFNGSHSPNQGGFGGQGNPNQGGHNNPNQGGYGRNPNQGPRNEQGAFERQFCRMFQFGQPCKFGETCKNKHAFSSPNQDLVHRIQFLRVVPNHVVSKLTKFSSGDKNFFAMRNGNQVNFFDFNFDTKALGEVSTYNFPDANGKYHYYDHKNTFIYYSKQNPNTSFQDIGIHNLQLQKDYYIANAHEGLLTGIVHFKDNLVMTTSMTGQFKVWVQEGDKLICHMQTVQMLLGQFNPQRAKIELYFLDISEVSGTKITSVGTSDGRLLFWIGQDMQFKQVQLAEQYSRVFKVRYSTRQGVPTAVILTWNNKKTHSAVLQIDLSNFNINPLLQVRTTQDQPKNIISLIEFVHGYLVVANLNGLVSVYAYPDTTTKIGAIMHMNAVNDIVAVVDNIKTTAITVKLMLILQKKIQFKDGNAKEGSLGIYIVK